MIVPCIVIPKIVTHGHSRLSSLVHYVASQFLSLSMATTKEIQLLVKTISTLSSSLPPSVPKATTKDKIWCVMHAVECQDGFETFNKRFDALFGEDCRDSEGRLEHIRAGKSGMGLISAYLKKIDWSQGYPLDLVKIKLDRLSTELRFIVYVYIYTVSIVF